MKKALLYTLVFIIVQFVGTYGVIFIWMLCSGQKMSQLTADTLTNAPMLLVISAVVNCVLLILFLSLRWSVVSRRYFQSRPWGVLFWAVIAAIGTLLPSVFLEELMPLPDVNAEMFSQMMSSYWGFFIICIFIPFVEELIFRGAILRALLNSSCKPWIAIMLSALIFGVVHFNPAQIPHAFLIGLLLGWMYWRTGSILPGVALHWVNNTAVYVATRLLPVMNDPDARLSDLFNGRQNYVYLAVLFSLCILVPAIFQLHQRMKKAG